MPNQRERKTQKNQQNKKTQTKQLFQWTAKSVNEFLKTARRGAKFAHARHCVTSATSNDTRSVVFRNLFDLRRRRPSVLCTSTYFYLFASLFMVLNAELFRSSKLLICVIVLAGKVSFVITWVNSSYSYKQRWLKLTDDFRHKFKIHSFGSNDITLVKLFLHCFERSRPKRASLFLMCWF